MSSGVGNPFTPVVVNGVGSPLFRRRVGVESLFDLFPTFWYTPSPPYIFADIERTTPAQLDGGIAAYQDRSGNGLHGTQTTSTARALSKQDVNGKYYALFDKADDKIIIDDFPTTDGTMVIGLEDGILRMGVSIAAGTYEIPSEPVRSPFGKLYSIFLKEGELTPAEYNRVVDDFVKMGASDSKFANTTSMKLWFDGHLAKTVITDLDCAGWDVSKVTNFSNFISNSPNITTLDVSNWDTSSATTLGSFARNCSGLESLDVSNWSTGGVTSVNSFTHGCSNLTLLDLSNWDMSEISNYTNFVRDCTSLTTVIVNGGTGNPFSKPDTDYIFAFTNTNLSQQSIDDILVAVATPNHTSARSFHQSGGSAPSAVGQAAIDTLRSKGWTVTVTGGY